MSWHVCFFGPVSSSLLFVFEYVFKPKGFFNFFPRDKSVTKTRFKHTINTSLLSFQMTELNVKCVLKTRLLKACFGNTFHEADKN